MFLVGTENKYRSNIFSDYSALVTTLMLFHEFSIFAHKYTIAYSILKKKLTLNVFMNKMYRIETGYCTVYTLHYKLYNVQYTLYTVNCILYTVHCTLYRLETGPPCKLL